jgi:hypothetical protein
MFQKNVGLFTTYSYWRRITRPHTHTHTHILFKTQTLHGAYEGHNSCAEMGLGFRVKGILINLRVSYHVTHCISSTHVPMTSFEVAFSCAEFTIYYPCNNTRYWHPIIYYYLLFIHLLSWCTQLLSRLQLHHSFCFFCTMCPVKWMNCSYL